MPPSGAALMVVGATSGAGKSTLVSALCRALARRGVDVAPFKAQNMSNHSAVTPDGGEIGRAQAMQALAARVETDRRMGPVLLKPSGARSSHLVVMGEEVGVADAVGYGDRARALRPVVLEALQSLRAEHEVVVLEGAGGAAEPNLLDRDLVNLPLAAAAGVPAVLVVDIDRGGAFASAYGTWAILPERLRAHLRGVVLNGFRGDPSLLEPAVADLDARTGMPVLGVLPHLGEHLMLGVEDSLDLGAPGRPVPQVGSAGAGAQGEDAEGSAGADGLADRPVRVAVVRLPRLANPSDLDPLVLEPSVELRWATRPGDLQDIDLVVLPGSRATVADLAWLRERGLDVALRRLVRDTETSTDALPGRSGPWVLGLCAGYQMLGVEIDDPIESGRGVVDGLGLLPVRTRFTAPKTVTRSLWGYQIRWGRPEMVDHAEAGARPWISVEGGVPEGCVSPDGRVRGTSLHGILDDERTRHALLAEVAAARGRTFVPSPTPYAAALDAHLDHLAQWAEANLDVAALLELSQTAHAPDGAPGW